MRLTPRNKTKLRRNMAIYRDYDDVIKGEKCLDILGSKKYIINDDGLVWRSRDIDVIESSLTRSTTRMVAEALRRMKPTAPREFVTIQDKQRKILEELSQRLNQVISRHQVSVGRTSDGISSLDYGSQVYGPSRRFSIRARVIPAMNAMKKEDGFVSVFHAVVNSETYKGTYPIGCTNFHVEEHDMGEIRYCFLHFFRTDKQRDKGIQYKWMCQTKGMPCVIGIGDCPDSAFKAMRRYAAKRVVKEIDTTMEKRRV